ncbi:hypothetical protein [Novosphingobium sp.]|uniref:hypothetical protein n=1 Tax=Novosphingobium sp. TaxID=1874826 RepID=UPI0031DA4031
MSNVTARSFIISDLPTIVFILLVAYVADKAAMPSLMFPELAALAYGIFKAPYGPWARAPVMLVATPLLVGAVGTLVTRHLDYGPVSVLLTVGIAIAMIAALKSPIAPAMSAGLFPLTLGIRSTLYAPSLLLGLGTLALLSPLWRCLVVSPASAVSSRNRDETLQAAPKDWSWVPFFLAFLVIALALVQATGWRFLLFPPLVVIAFEMFAHAQACPWAQRPFTLPILCSLTAGMGLVLVVTWGSNPLAAAATVLFGIMVLRLFDLHLPPALAIGLLPFVIPNVDYSFVIGVSAGTLLLALCFCVWRAMVSRRLSSVLV